MSLHLDVLHIDNHNILWYIRTVQLFVHHLQIYYLHRTRC
nr:MAG TPA: hypothetical protein [Caudoviricetes sp.]